MPSVATAKRTRRAGPACVLRTMTRPSPCFDATTAPPAVLEALGILARPSPDDVGYDVWVSRYGKTTGSSWVEPPPYVVTGITSLHDPRPLRIKRQRHDGRD